MKLVNKILEIAFSGFFQFIGIFILFYIAVHYFVNFLNRVLRMIMVTLRGWPPEHLDADGDWNEYEDEPDTEQ